MPLSGHQKNTVAGCTTLPCLNGFIVLCFLSSQIIELNNSAIRRYIFEKISSSNENIATFTLYKLNFTTSAKDQLRLNLGKVVSINFNTVSLFGFIVSI